MNGTPENTVQHHIQRLCLRTEHTRVYNKSIKLTFNRRLIECSTDM